MAGRASKPQVDSILGAIGCLVASRSAVYVSTPLTTGRRWAEWAAQAGAPNPGNRDYGRLLEAAVVGPNRENARHFVQALRTETHATVIDPSALPDVSGWTQPDYRAFWAEVIERYAQTVVFLDGWEYSHGCAYEYLVATKCGAETLSQDMAPITLSQAIALIRAAIQEFLKRGQPVDFLEEIVGRLDRERSARA